MMSICSEKSIFLIAFFLKDIHKPLKFFILVSPLLPLQLIIYSIFGAEWVARCSRIKCQS